MFSLKEINDLITKSWKIIEPNETNNEKFNDILFKECIRTGLWDENDKRGKFICVNLGIGSEFFHPNESIDSKILCSQMIIWSLLFDDFIDDEINEIEIVKYQIKRMENIIFNNNLPKDYSKFENFSYILMNKYRNLIKENKELLNRLFSKILEYLNSIVPFHQLNIEKINNLNILRYIRNHNLSTQLFLPMIEVIHPEIKVDSSFWYNPKLIKISEMISYLLELINDTVSFEKEKNSNSINLNIFNLFQTKLNLTLSESYEKIKDEIKKTIEEIDILAIDLFNDYTNESELNNVKFFLNYLKQLVWGELQRSLKTNRYYSKNSIFLELRK